MTKQLLNGGNKSSWGIKMRGRVKTLKNVGEDEMKGERRTRKEKEKDKERR